MRRLFIACLVLGSFLFATAASAERRAALVIGNGDYKNAVKLPNPPADAQAIAALLKTQGFQVVSGINLDREGMSRKLGEFAEVARGADVTMFFYAGHGFQVEGKNLLVPIDADIRTELDAKMRAIEIDSVLHHTMGDSKVKIVLLDACRDNPFANQIRSTMPATRSVVVSTGLAEMRPGEGTLIAFATGPGQVALDGAGKHSPFTSALLRHIATPGVEIRHALTQVRAQVQEDTRKQQLPWENTNLTGFFYMNKAQNTAALVPEAPRPGGPSDAASQPRGMDPVQLELTYWTSVQRTGRLQDYQAYLAQYPDGTFAGLARNEIAALSKPASAAVPTGSITQAAAPAAATAAYDPAIKTAQATRATEDAIGLDDEGWRAVKRKLAAVGHNPRSTDGRPGDTTRRAITRWQSELAYPASGYLNKLQHDALMAQAVSKTATNKDDGDNSGGTQKRVQRREAPAPAPGLSPGQAGELIGGALRGLNRGGTRLPF